MQAFRTVLGDNDMLAYLSMMAPRLMELRRVLKATGSIYLHCDPTASHYLKMLMDAIFGPENFHNEIIWKRTNARTTQHQHRYPRIHDVLLFYAKTTDFRFRSLKTEADQAKLPHTLITGDDGLKYQTIELTAPGITKEGDSGKPWRGYDPSTMGRHWANHHSQMEEWDAAGLIHWAAKGVAGGFPRRRASDPFNPESREITVADIWADIDRINQQQKSVWATLPRSRRLCLNALSRPAVTKATWFLTPSAVVAPLLPLLRDSIVDGSELTLPTLQYL